MWGAPSSTPQRRPARLEQRGAWACAPEARDTGCLLDSAENEGTRGPLLRRNPESCATRTPGWLLVTGDP